MTVSILDRQPADPTRAAGLVLNPMAAGLQLSRILSYAQEVRDGLAQGRQICNLTVGDFSPDHFRAPAALIDQTATALREGYTNYPHPQGDVGLREAVARLYAEQLGVESGPECVVVCSGTRPVITAAWIALVQPGDRTISFAPSWNVGHYARLTRADHRFIRTHASEDFFPTVAQAAEAMRGARLVLLNSPLNPAGTVISADRLRGITQALVDENRRRGWDSRNGRCGDEPPCMLIYDQVYWMLRAAGQAHHNPVALVPDAAPFVIHADSISKNFAATGMRVGWGLLPPYLVPQMTALLGHLGTWAPHAEQVAAGRFLSQPDLVAESLAQLNVAISARLDRLYQGLSGMRAQGLPVDVIEPQGAMHLSFRIDRIGRGFANTEDLRRWLLQEVGVAVVPFQAFDRAAEDGWLRMSVGNVGLEELDGAIDRISTALRGL